jgi:prevent-host-death family protein
MDPVSIREAKAKFSAMIEGAGSGKTIVVTNHGRPVAVIAPFNEEGGVEHPNRLDPAGFKEALLALPHDLDF